MNMRVTKTCRKCGQTKPATTEFFRGASRSVDRLSGTCKECKAVESLTPLAATPKPDCTVTLDFTGYEGLWDHVNLKAADSFRTVEAQILYMISQDQEATA